MRKIVLRHETAFWRGSDFGWLGQTDSPSGLSAIDMVEPLTGPKAPSPVTAAQTNWTDHPWVGGGYATWPKPWTTDDPWKPMRASHDGPCFTGTELAPAFPGFIEGAVRAGRESAARLLQQN